MPGTDKISVYRGTDVTIQFTMSPVEDISGWTLTFTVTGSRGALFSKTCALTDPANGKFSADVASADTKRLAPGMYSYDAWRTDEGSQRVVAIGPFEVLGTARRAP